MTESNALRGKRRYDLPSYAWLNSRPAEMAHLLSPQTITRIGVDQRYTGATAALNLQFQDMLRSGQPTPNVYDFYDQVFSIGIEDYVRTFGKGERSSLYNANGYSSAIAEAMGIDEQVLRRLLRAYRATAVYEALSFPVINESSTFQKSMGSLFENDQTLRPTQRDDRLVTVMTEWNGTIAHFYRIMGKQEANGKWLGRFLPYEMDFFIELVGRLRKSGNTLSIFSKKIMQGVIDKKTLKEMGDIITSETGVKVDKSVIDDYIYLLSKDFTC
jgi:hypothetical protein